MLRSTQRPEVERWSANAAVRRAAEECAFDGSERSSRGAEAVALVDTSCTVSLSEGGPVRCNSAAVDDVRAAGAWDTPT